MERDDREPEPCTASFDGQAHRVDAASLLRMHRDLERARRQCEAVELTAEQVEWVRAQHRRCSRMTGLMRPVASDLWRALWVGIGLWAVSLLARALDIGAVEILKRWLLG